MHWARSGLLLGFGHALTVDAAQGITSAEHINALPRGSAGITAFKSYVAESRSRGATWTVVSDAAVHEAEKRSRALGDAAPITAADLWKRVAADMSAKPYKALGMDLDGGDERDGRDRAIFDFIRRSHALQSAGLAGRDVGREVRQRLRAEAARAAVAPHLGGLVEGVRWNEEALRVAAREGQAERDRVRGAAETARVRTEPASPAGAGPSRSVRM